MASETWLLLAASALAAVALARSGAASCQCEAGDYWCSSDGFLRYTYNCSGSDRAKALWKKIGGEEHPQDEDCQALSTVCEGFAGAHSRSAANQTCDDDCYEYCWKKDVGDCADMDDQQMFCVGQCMNYCSVTKCGAKTHEWSSCQSDCNAKYMEGNEVNFIDYSNCMSKCTLVPISPHGSEVAHPTSLKIALEDPCHCDEKSYWCANEALPTYAYNCSTSTPGKNGTDLYNRIQNAPGGQPAQEDCNNLQNVCEDDAGAYGKPAANTTQCEHTCHGYCWGNWQQKGQCAHPPTDQSFFCYGVCMDYCIGTNCTNPPKQWSDCQHNCEVAHPLSLDIYGNQVDYSNCMASCTTVPIAPPTPAPQPHGQQFLV